MHFDKKILIDTSFLLDVLIYCVHNEVRVTAAYIVTICQALISARPIVYSDTISKYLGENFHKP